MTLRGEKKDLAELSTLKIGGWTDSYYEIKSTGELEELLNKLYDPEEAIVVGRGSNILFPEGKFERPVIKLTGSFEKYEFNTEGIKAGAGTFFPQLALDVAQEGFSGLEWSAGVPGTVGGAVAMNAGAYDCETSDVLLGVEYIDFDTGHTQKSIEDINFKYRYCELKNKGIIVSARFELEEEKQEDEPIQRTKKLLRQRREEQPVGTTSAGCVFKNSNGTSAGRLIDEAGMKGETAGDIKVSETHANYFVNCGNGTYEQMRSLIERVREKVDSQFDYELETELQIINET